MLTNLGRDGGDEGTPDPSESLAHDRQVEPDLGIREISETGEGAETAEKAAHEGEESTDPEARPKSVSEKRQFGVA